MVTSAQETLIQKAVSETGYYHLKMLNVTDERIEALENNRDIKNIFTIYQKGYGLLENGQNEDKPYLKLYSMDKSIFENLKFNLKQGRFPVNENEIIISRHIIYNGKVDLKIGDKINIKVGERETLDGKKLGSSAPYQKELEQLANAESHEFTIVGIIERPEYEFEKYSDPGYSVITTNFNEGSKEIYISLKKPKDYKTVLPMLLGVSSYKNLSDSSDLHEINSEILRWETFAFSDTTIQMLYMVCGIVIFIIIFTSVFCIRNSMLIATTEKMKMYGILSSIGATKKQIKKNVIFESLALGIVGVPLGIISGIFAVYVLIKIVNSIFYKYLLISGNEIILKVTYLPIFISVLMGFLTIYLSALSSAKKASKVSPIELLRNSAEIKINSKKLKTPFIISKIFKTGGSLAYKNLKRNRKKYRTTVISLVVSIFVFITMNAFINNMFGVTNNYYKEFDYNVMISARVNALDKSIEKVKKCENVDEIFVPYEYKNSLEIYDRDKINEEYYKSTHIVNIDDEKQQDTEKETCCNLRIIGLERDTFNKYLKKLGINKDIGKQGILCDEYNRYIDDKIVKERIYTYKKGDSIRGKIEGKDFEVKIKNITTIKPYGYEQVEYMDGLLVVNLDEYKDINFEAMRIAVNTSDSDKFVEELEKLDIDRELSIINFDSIVREQKGMKLIVEIFLYGFITVITLVGVTNIFNTITSNMELRKREFASLKSIGMTKKEFNRMINLETIFYSMKSLVYGIILALLGTFALYKAFSIKIEKGMYIPINPIIISIIAVFILVFAIMKYSMSKINKQNIIETIRNENI